MEPPKKAHCSCTRRKCIRWLASQAGVPGECGSQREVAAMSVRAVAACGGEAWFADRKGVWRVEPGRQRSLIAASDGRRLWAVECSPAGQAFAAFVSEERWTLARLVDGSFAETASLPVPW